MSRPYAVVAGSRRVAMSGARATGPCYAHTTLEVTLKLRRKAELPALDGRPAKAMTRAELAAQYGASDEDVDAVVKAFAAFGIKPVATSAATRHAAVVQPEHPGDESFTSAGTWMSPTRPRYGTSLDPGAKE